jgi:polysaccharide export outer membrane protein
VRASPEIIRSSVRYQKEYLLFAGDVIEVVVWRNPEVSRTATIRPDGFISLPLLQEVKAAGLTPKELADSIAKMYSGRLLNPEVTVLPTTVRQPTVYVLGDVRNPGGYPIRTSVTAAQAVAAAGGVLRSGGESDIALIRMSEDGYLEAIPVGGRISVSQVGPYMSLAATPVRPDDILFVPETGRSQIFRALTDLLVPYTIYLNYRLIQQTLK